MTFTPFNPSPKAEAQVTDKLPIPTTCPRCGSTVIVARNSVIYNGKEYGDYPWIYLCTNRSCMASIGLHRHTAIPLGTLADSTLRRWRMKAKDAFNPLWQDGPYNRSQAYAWLASELGIKVNECHFGWFDKTLCERAIKVIQERGNLKNNAMAQALSKAKVESALRHKSKDFSFQNLKRLKGKS